MRMKDCFNGLAVDFWSGHKVKRERRCHAHFFSSSLALLANHWFGAGSYA